MDNVKESWNRMTSELNRIRKRGSEAPYYYQAIRGLFDQIPKLVLHNDSPGTEVNLVHYTTWSNALNMFKENQNEDQMESREDDRKDSQEKKQNPPILRMYNYEQSNDPDEGRIKPPEWKKIEKEAGYFDKFMEDDGRWIKDMTLGWGTYGCSFSSGLSDTGDDLEDDMTYWRLYGNNGQGCSLKISNPLNEHIYRVRYRDKDFSKRSDKDKEEDEQVSQRLRNLLEICKEITEEVPERHKYFVGKTVAEGLFRIIHSYYHLIKDVAYKGEKEWRMIRVMPRPDAIRFDTSSGNIIKRYVEGPPLSQLLSSASAITVGPTVPNRGAARAYLEYLAKEVHNIPYVNVKNSSQNYRQV